MRLFLIPLSTRRTLLYGQRLNILTTDRQSLLDRATARAAKLWASWEARESGWQRRVVDGGNALLRKIPYEEWSLKSVPPLSARRRRQELKDQGQGKGHIEVIFPESVIPKQKVEGVLQTLATEREAHHKRWLFWCFVGMPISAPFALVPIIPNLPFFYLVYRAWSHWRAIAGGKHIKFLVENKLLTPRPSPMLDQIYQGDSSRKRERRGDNDSGEEKILLSQEQGKMIAQQLGVHALETELERAVWQVKTTLPEREKKDEPAEHDKDEKWKEEKKHRKDEFEERDEDDKKWRDEKKKYKKDTPDEFDDSGKRWKEDKKKNKKYEYDEYDEHDKYGKKWKKEEKKKYRKD